MSSIVPLTDLQASLEWELDTDETRLATGALEEASELMRAYGRAGWDETKAPALIRRLIIKIVARHLRNPDGYIQSRAGDETLMWSDQRGNAAGIYLTPTEEALIKKAAGNRSLLSVPIVAYRTVERLNSYVPVEGGGKPFPFTPDSPQFESPTVSRFSAPSFPTDAIPTSSL